MMYLFDCCRPLTNGIPPTINNNVQYNNAAAVDTRDRERRRRDRNEDRDKKYVTDVIFFLNIEYHPDPVENCRIDLCDVVSLIK